MIINLSNLPIAPFLDLNWNSQHERRSAANRGISMVETLSITVTDRYTPYGQHSEIGF